MIRSRLLAARNAPRPPTTVASTIATTKSSLSHEIVCDSRAAGSYLEATGARRSLVGRGIGGWRWKADVPNSRTGSELAINAGASTVARSAVRPRTRSAARLSCVAARVRRSGLARGDSLDTGVLVGWPEAGSGVSASRAAGAATWTGSGTVWPASAPVCGASGSGTAGATADVGAGAVTGVGGIGDGDAGAVCSATGAGGVEGGAIACGVGAGAAAGAGGGLGTPRGGSSSSGST
jgi:hypothetical protein